MWNEMPCFTHQISNAFYQPLYTHQMCIFLCFSFLKIDTTNLSLIAEHWIVGFEFQNYIRAWRFHSGNDEWFLFFFIIVGHCSILKHDFHFENWQTIKSNDKSYGYCLGNNKKLPCQKFLDLLTPALSPIRRMKPKKKMIH